jgi:hypothetical protein
MDLGIEERLTILENKIDGWATVINNEQPNNNSGCGQWITWILLLMIFFAIKCA